jgi:aryl-alcohol dehydrogenase-like predicted oxidoreductase
VAPRRTSLTAVRLAVVEHRRLGRSGLLVSRLALGTMGWGRDCDEDVAQAQLASFRDAGGTLIDTADVYGGGESERLVGSLLRGSARSELIIATKAGARAGDGPLASGTSRRRLLAALEGSLTRLRTDHVDLWQVHTWHAETPLEETLGALDAAVSSGKVRYVGISNYSGWQTSKAAATQLLVSGRSPLVSTQMEYSLLSRGIEREVVPAALDAGLGILPWSPLGRGVLAGTYGRSRESAPAGSRAASPTWNRFVDPYLTDESNRVVEAVRTAAKGLGVTPVAVALSWVRDRPGVVAPILGARTAAQLDQSLESEELTLPPSIRSALDDVSGPTVGYPERLPWE